MARVLIVDDEQSIRASLGTFAKNAGHAVSLARDAAEALDLLGKDPFDVVVTDIILPRRTGVALLADIREAHPDVQVIMITGEPEVGTAAEAVRKGAFDYLSKPISREDITKTVFAAAEKKTLLDKNRRLEEENLRYREHLEGLVEVQTRALRASKEVTDRLLDQQIAVNELALELGNISEIDRIYEAVYQHVRTLMDVKSFIISFYDEEEQLIRAGCALFQNKDVDVSKLPPIPLAQEGHGTQSRVIHTGEPLYVSDYRKARKKGSTEYTVNPDGSVKKGAPPEDEEDITRSTLFVPLKLKGKVIGVMQVQSNQLDGYTKNDMALLAGLANVTAVAIANSRLVQEIRDVLEGTVHIVGDTVEIRDPYTAGHQRRVTELASAIGTKLDLPEEKIEGLCVAGLLHDIGKMAIPAEILSKPTRLTEVEFSLIRNHPQVAYDLLKRIRFQWPVAQIVLQHHERMDGSGYPQGLKENDILLEARILAVSDVVEAMAAHRPYRAALGVDAALEEISKNKGRLYSEDVVDACLQLFTKEEFSFEEQR
jgi:putative nucleotidyltransferase with HDIG domain